MGNMKKANYIISVIMLWVGVGVVALASSLKIKIGEGDPGAGFWPMMLGILIIVFSVCLLISTIKNKEKLEAKTFTISTPANIRVYILFGIIVLCGAVFSRILYWCTVVHSGTDVSDGSTERKEDCSYNDYYTGSCLYSVWHAPEHFSAGTDIYEIRR